MNGARETKFLSLNLFNCNRVGFQVIGQKCARGMQSKLAAEELGNQGTPNNLSTLQAFAAEEESKCVWVKFCALSGKQIALSIH